MADNFQAAQLSSLPNGSGAAAILSAGVGSFVLAMLAFVADKSAGFKALLIFYKPTGPLSGDSIIAIGIWLLCWAVLEWRWRRRDVEIRIVCSLALILLGLSFLLTFPPIVDLL